MCQCTVLIDPALMARSMSQTAAFLAMQDSVEIYDVRTDSWRYVANMEASRAYGAAVTVDGNVYALGGMRNAHHNEVVERYDGSSDSWHKITPPTHILHKRAFLAACVVDMG